METVRKVKLGDILSESTMLSTNPNPAKRISVRLNCQGVERRPVTNEVEGATNYFIRRAGQFIYGKQNLFKGAFGVIPDELDGFESSSDLPSFDISKDCLPEYLNSYFKQDHFYKGLENIARGAASKRISPKNLFDVEIDLPDLPTQKSIVARLQSLQALHREADATLARLRANVKRLRQSILQEAIQGKLVDYKSAPGEKSGGDLLADIRAEKERRAREAGKKPEAPLPPVAPEEMPFEVPEGWVWCRLGDVTDSIVPNRDKPLSFTGNIPWVTQSNFQQDKFFFDFSASSFGLTEIEVAKYNARIMPPDSVVMSCVGRFDLVAVNDRNIVANQQLHCFVPFKGINPMFLAFVIYSFAPDLERQAISTTIKYANKGKCEGIKLPLPPARIQNEISQAVLARLTQCDKLKQQLAALQTKTERLWKSELQQTFKFESNG